MSDFIRLDTRDNDVEVVTIRTPWCRITSSPKGYPAYSWFVLDTKGLVEGKEVYVFCLEGLGKWDVSESDIVRLVISKEPFRGCQSTAYNDSHTTMYIAKSVRNQMPLRSGETVYWAPEILDEENGY